MKQLAIISTCICLICVSILCLFTIYENRKSNYHPSVDYVFNIVENCNADSIVVYRDDLSYVGTVKLQGELDSLIIDDNQ